MLAFLMNAQHCVQTYSTFWCVVGLPAFHIQAQNHSQHVAPLNEELLRKQSQDSVNGECWSEGKKRYWREAVMQPREVNRFKGMEPESAAPTWKDLWNVPRTAFQSKLKLKSLGKGKTLTCKVCNSGVHEWCLGACGTSRSGRATLLHLSCVTAFCMAIVLPVSCAMFRERLLCRSPLPAQLTWLMRKARAVGLEVSRAATSLDDPTACHNRYNL